MPTQTKAPWYEREVGKEWGGWGKDTHTQQISLGEGRGASTRVAKDVVHEALAVPRKVILPAPHKCGPRTHVGAVALQRTLPAGFLLVYLDQIILSRSSSWAGGEHFFW